MFQYMPPTQSKNITQPADWWTAFQAEADARGMSLSAWMGGACLASMINQGKRGRAKVAKLSPRPLASRPPKNEVAK